MKKNQKSCDTDPKEKYQNKWIAFSNDEKEILAADRSFTKAMEKANQKGEKDPVMFKVPPKSVCLVI